MLAWSIRMSSSVILAVQRFQPHIFLIDQHRTYLLTTFSIEFLVSVTPSFSPVWRLTSHFKTVVGSCYILRIQQPPSIRLVDTHGHQSRSGTPLPDSRGVTPASTKPLPTIEPDALLSLSLSSKPVLPKSKPVFGLPSLQGSTSMRNVPITKEEIVDEMDWTPTNPDADLAVGKRVSNDNNDWLRPQRFFAPEKPTGLEGLFESTRLQDETTPLQPGSLWIDTNLIHMFTNHLWKWAPLYTLFLGILVASLAYTFNWHDLVRWAP